MVFAVAGGGQLDTGYTIDNSLRFNDNDGASLSRTFGSGGNRKTWTWSGWIKRGELGTINSLFECRAASNDNQTLGIEFGEYGTSNNYIALLRNSDRLVKTSADYRDVSAWYHVVVAFDTTQSTASNRVRIYINGVEQTYQYTNFPSQNADQGINQAATHTIGNSNGTTFDGYMAEINFIDGQQLDPTDFGEFDADSGIWKPISYTGSYGTTGFYLDFENSSSLGTDQSGNGNNFTPVNLASTDQMVDTPTNNFCTLNSITATPTTLSEGNLKSYTSGTSAVGVGTIPMTTGKWYAEVCCPNSTGEYPRIGIFNVEADSTPNDVGGASTGWCLLNNPSRKYHSGSSSSYGSFTLGGGEIVGIAYDADNGKIWFSKNGVFVGTVDSSGEAFSSISGQIAWAIADGNAGSTAILNAGQDSSFAGNKTRQNNTDENGYGDFYYTPPSGYLALCTQNLATELTIPIDNSQEYFNAVLYSGNAGTNRSITGMGFQPDFLWHKDRSSDRNHSLVDSSRGTNASLQSNSTAAESTMPSFVSFDSDGFTITQDGSTNPNWNESGVTKVVWGWKVNGGTTSTNTNGSITTTVQANQDAGISILTYVGTQANATIGHGLSKAPEVMIAKVRNEGTYGWGGNWWTYKNTGQIQLNVTSAYYENAVYWQNTDPSSTVITMGGQVEANRSGKNMIAYCFHSVEGFSKFGQYVGNGSSNGIFVYTGFRPAFVMVKCVSSSQSGNAHWVMYDVKRNTYNVVDELLYANLSNNESQNDSSRPIDILSNGFKFRGSGSASNSSGATYIYMAFAENPFVSSTGIPVTAR